MKALCLAFLSFTLGCAAPPSPASKQPSGGLHDVTIFASNVAELRAFYSKLGFELAFSDDDKLVVFIIGPNELAIHTSEQKPAQALALSVLVEDLDGVQAKLKAANIAFDGPRQMRPGMTGVEVRDPNGNSIAFLKRESR